MTATFTSPFKTLPKAHELRALAFPQGVPEMPYRDHEANHATPYERDYLDLLVRCLLQGKVKTSRPGQHTLMIDDSQLVIDISSNQLPLLSTRYVPYKSFIIENLWFISGSTDVAFLKQHNVNIWDEWVIPETAVFQPAQSYKAGEMLNWVRCTLGLEVYKSWRNYQSTHNIARPTVGQVQDWWAGSGQEGTIPMVSLQSGSIGEGAYGAQWRRRVDNHVIYTPCSVLGTDEDHTKEAERIEDEYIAKHPHYRVASHSKELISRDGVQCYEIVSLLSGVYDQLGDVIKALRRETPDSRRIIMDAWDPAKVKDCALPPCHPWVQFISHVNEQTGQRELTLKLTMR